MQLQLRTKGFNASSVIDDTTFYGFSYPSSTKCVTWSGGHLVSKKYFWEKAQSWNLVQQKLPWELVDDVPPCMR